MENGDVAAVAQSFPSDHRAVGSWQKLLLKMSMNVDSRERHGSLFACLFRKGCLVKVIPL